MIPLASRRGAGLWYADQAQFLNRSPVDFPANINTCGIDGVDYYESFDSFGGLSASAIGLCDCLQNYLEGFYVLISKCGAQNVPPNQP